MKIPSLGLAITQLKSLEYTLWKTSNPLSKSVDAESEEEHFINWIETGIGMYPMWCHNVCTSV